MKTLAIFLVALSVASCAHWAVLVAGSDGFSNYRHQADICHAYHILLEKGMPAENIIVFATDDIANNSRNPFPGKIYNKPDGEDVYAGCVIDYSGADVTPDNFLAVLRGDASAVKGGNGKVLKSTKEDHVFINFSDHGSSNLIAFPRSYLYADKQFETLKYMHENGLYGELTYYLEACYSGSMFEKFLTPDMNIYATSAANSHESSWGYYCYPNDTVGGKHVGSCLGDLYSIVWMEDSDAADVCTETIGEQTDIVTAKTTKSHVMEWGDQSIRNELVGDYVGDCSKRTPTVKSFLNWFETEETKEYNTDFAIDSRDIKLHYLYSQYMINKTAEAAFDLQEEINSRQRIEERFARFRGQLGMNADADADDLKDFDCYRNLIESYHARCGTDEYDLKFFGAFAAACQYHTGLNHADLISTMC